MILTQGLVDTIAEEFRKRDEEIVWLKKENVTLSDECIRDTAEIERVRKALEFYAYANEAPYFDDAGEIAKKVLEESK